MATEYISTETGCQYLRKYKIEDGTSFLYDEGFNDGIETAISCIGIEVPAADVVARDCYDRILAENDTMREMLARTGKKCGDSMDDVRQVVRGKWIRGNESRTSPTKDSYICSVCGEKTLSGFCGNPAKTNFCPNCGADMRPYKDGRRGENDSG